MPKLPHEIEIPSYDYRFQTYSKPVFYHRVDGQAAVLQVDVFGPNLTYTFCHNKAREKYNAAQLTLTLSRKTVGYSSLVVNTDERIVLAWAESGHGSSSAGEMLDATPFALPNASWTRRAAAVTRLLRINAHSMFDNPWGSKDGDAKQFRGIFSGSHVEVKLATHAVFFLLRQFDIVSDIDSVTVQHLTQLRNVLWSNKTRPAFEIHFSRAPCPRCQKFIRRLQHLTQISLELRWYDRLTEIDYERVDNGANPKETMPYPEDDTVSVCSEADSVDTLAAEDTEMKSVETSPTANTKTSWTKLHHDDVLYIGTNSRSVTPALVIDLTRESRQSTALEPVEGDVDKPLPATAEFNEPTWMASLRRSPRPYCSSVLGNGCTCGVSCSNCSKN